VLRRKVVWWGGHPPYDITRELHNRDLELLACEDDDALIDREVRAVLLPHHPRKGARALEARVKRLRGPISDRGGSIFVIVFGEMERQAAILQTSNLVEARVLDGTAAILVAEACARLQPGPAVGAATITAAPPRKLSPQDALLMTRAFNDYEQLDLTALTGGLTEASVWRVKAVDKTGRVAQPFLVKAGNLRTITEEIETMRAFVLDHMPFPNRPPLIVERCVRGLDRRLLVSMLVEKADRLDDYLAKGGSVEKIAHAIFDGPLRCWRDNKTERELQLGLVYEQQIRGPVDPNTGSRTKDGHLAEALRLARTVVTNAPDPLEIVERVAKYPKRTTKTCQAHGDLHPRNVFVRHNSDEIILIDFAKSGNVSSPIVWDAATLDVALAFDGWNDPSTMLQPSEIELLYAPQLFAVGDSGSSPRSAMSVRVRGRARADCSDDSEYVVAVVAALMRTARLLAASKGADSQRAALHEV
jgi:hypothetical protein